MQAGASTREVTDVGLLQQLLHVVLTLPVSPTLSATPLAGGSSGSAASASVSAPTASLSQASGNTTGAPSADQMFMHMFAIATLKLLLWLMSIATGGGSDDDFFPIADDFTSTDPPLLEDQQVCLVAATPLPHL